MKILSRRRDEMEEQDGNTFHGVIRLIEFLKPHFQKLFELVSRRYHPPLWIYPSGMSSKIEMAIASICKNSIHDGKIKTSAIIKNGRQISGVFKEK